MSDAGSSKQLYPEGFIRSVEAGEFSSEIADPVTKVLVNNAHFHLFRRLAEKRFPDGNFDMLFCCRVDGGDVQRARCPSTNTRRQIRWRVFR